MIEVLASAPTSSAPINGEGRADMVDLFWVKTNFLQRADAINASLDSAHRVTDTSHTKSNKASLEPLRRQISKLNLRKNRSTSKKLDQMKAEETAPAKLEDRKTPPLGTPLAMRKQGTKRTAELKLTPATRESELPSTQIAVESLVKIEESGSQQDAFIQSPVSQIEVAATSASTLVSPNSSALHNRTISIESTMSSVSNLSLLQISTAATSQTDINDVAGIETTDGSAPKAIRQVVDVKRTTYSTSTRRRWLFRYLSQEKSLPKQPQSPSAAQSLSSPQSAQQSENNPAVTETTKSTQVSIEAEETEEIFYDASSEPLTNGTKVDVKGKQTAGPGVRPRKSRPFWIYLINPNYKTKPSASNDPEGSTSDTYGSSYSVLTRRFIRDEEADYQFALKLQKEEDEIDAREAAEFDRLVQEEEKLEKERKDNLERIAARDAQYAQNLLQKELEIQRRERNKQARLAREREKKDKKEQAARIKSIGARVVIKEFNRFGVLNEVGMDRLTSEGAKALAEVRRVFAKGFPKANITKIEWIINDKLVYKYEEAKLQLKASGRSINEKLLFHGTSQANVNLYDPCLR